MDPDQLKSATRDMWSRGHYAELARVLEPAAQALIDACAVSAGQEVLDVAAGTGNVAALAAEEGAMVTASDLTPILVEQGRDRTAADGLDVEWSVADVEELPYDDDSFECVASCFGAIFAPRPERAAAEMFRVVRPGGTVGLTSWTPAGFFGRVQALTAQHLAPPEGAPRPFDWGEEETARERLEPLAAHVTVERLTLPFVFDSAAAMWDFFTDNVGPFDATREQLGGEGYAALRGETLALAEEWNEATDGSFHVESEYLLAVARRRG